MAGVDGEFGGVRFSNEEVVAFVERFDREMVQEGIQPNFRPIELTRKISKEFNIFTATGKSNNPEIQKLFDFHNSLYRPSDLAVGSIHSGLAFHLDLFFRVDVPRVYGTINLKFLEHTDATDAQLKRIFSYKNESEPFVSDIVDVFDIGGCLGGFYGFSQPRAEAMRLFRMSAFHSQSVVATLSGIFDFKGAIQSALLSSELSIKAALIEIGKGERFLKKEIGHNLEKAIPFLCAKAGYDQGDLELNICELPNFVSSRYDTKDWSRSEVSKIAKSSQRLLATVSRKFSGKSFGTNL